MVCNIHQPAETLFRLADSLLVLSAGRVAYCGGAVQVREFS
jgi:ABC-type multidrug transport system ATPase subunit